MAGGSGLQVWTPDGAKDCADSVRLLLFRGWKVSNTGRERVLCRARPVYSIGRSNRVWKLVVVEPPDPHSDPSMFNLERICIGTLSATPIACARASANLRLEEKRRLCF